MRPILQRCARLATLALLTGLLSACANLAAVQTYADETKKLSTAFEPMLGESVGSCEQRQRRKKLITATNYDPAAVDADAQALCAPIAASNQAIERLNTLLALYADTLDALAREKLPPYRTDLDGLRSTDPAEGEAPPPMPAAGLLAIDGLVDLLARLQTQQARRSAIRELIDHQAAVQALADALSRYATQNYRAWLSDELRDIDGLHRVLRAEAATEPLAANHLDNILLGEQRQLQARLQAIDRFVAAAEQMGRSHAELRAHFDHPDHPALARQLSEFSKEVRVLQKQVRYVF